MDWGTIVGLIGTLVTIEEAGRGWFSDIKKIFAKRKIRLCNWDSTDPVTQRLLDAFKSSAYAEYKEHIFSEDEIEEIIKRFLEEKSYLKLSYKESGEIAKYIGSILGKYNEYTRSQMSLGDNIIYDKMEDNHQEIKDGQKEIKELLHDIANKEHTQNLSRFLEVVEESKSVGLANIESFINSEYEIDRTEFVKKVKDANDKFITIHGCAGSGKSVLAKKIVLDEQYILYARAERFAEEKNTTDIWQCDLKDALEQLSTERVVFFIDALEFIADCASEKIELLQSLYYLASKHSNVHIVTTCRTEDRNAFIKMETQFSIATYEVDDISEVELNGICSKYPVIRKLREEKTYASLLKSPFYVNLIVSKMPDNHDIQSESSFRDYIWNNIICLGKKCIKYGISSSDVKNTIQNIVFTRAKNFLVGVHCSEVADDILQALITEGIVVQKGKYVRLKYDIFEDICFEQFFDKSFDLCKGDFSVFFSEIEKIGRCVYRRYQIWISNKLFLRCNREKFIYALFFDKTIFSKWKSQTEIGIVKSKYCAGFFEEYFCKLVEEGYIEEIIRVTNLYAFEAKVTNKQTNKALLSVTPIGKARESLLVLLNDNWEDIKQKVDKFCVIRLCEDYAKQKNRSEIASIAACKIIENYIEEVENAREDGWYYQTDKTMMPLLQIVYMMADASTEWIKRFFVKLQTYCDSDDAKEQRFAYELIEETLKNTYPILAKSLPKNLCDLANRLWLNCTEKEYGFGGYYEHDLGGHAYGLSKYADHYRMSRNGVYEHIFLWNILTEKFEIGFEWAIKFVNQTITNYADKKPDYICQVPIYFADEERTKEYLGSPELWLAGIQEHTVPTIIGDVVYVLKTILVNSIRNNVNDEEYIKLFATYVRKKIYSKANNIALLSIIEAIGLNFQKELPGYALDLASSFEIIYWDMHRYGLYIKNPAKELLEQQILRAVGIPSLNERYKRDEKCNINLQQYVINMQLIASEEVTNKCNNICDCMYSQVKNEGEEADLYLQIQKMDLRNAALLKVAENTYAVEPQITGEAKRIVERNEENSVNMLAKQIQELVTVEASIVREDKPNYEKLDEVIDVILDAIAKDEGVRIQYENVMIQLIAIALNNKEMNITRRDKLVNIWLDGVDQYFNHGSFVTDDKFIFVLFEQLKENCSVAVKNRIKKTMLDSLLERENNGLVSKIASQAKLYLQKEAVFAKAMFNTILMLAKDEMTHQVYNANYLILSGRDDKYEFVPNKQLKLSGVERWIREDGEMPYTSEKDVIIEKYLWNEEELQDFVFKIEEYDIGILCYVSNCGLNLSNKMFQEVMRSIIICLIELWNYDKGEHEAYRIVDAYAEHEVMEFFWKEIVEKDENTNKAIDLLFGEIDFTLFTRETIEFYQEIFGYFLCVYFDAYSEKGRRKIIENKLAYLENKICGISDEYVRKQLYKSLTLALTQYCHGGWSKAKTAYVYEDKMFLNKQFEKYGKYHIKDMIQTIYQLRIDELLPEILLSTNKAFNEAMQGNKKAFEKDISEVQWIVDYLILKAFVYKSDEIKADNELTGAFEGVLLSMIELNNPKAAVILDEFRIH